MIDDPVYGELYAGPIDLPDGRIAYVAPLTFGRARINVGDPTGVHDAY